MKNYIVFVCTVLFGFYHTAGFSQVLSKDSVKISRSFWLATGGGVSSLGYISLGIDINAELSDRWLISASASGESSSLLDFSTTHQTDVTALSISTGKIFKQKFSFITLCAGVGYLSIHTSNSAPGILGQIYSNTYRNTVGIPISVSGYLVALQALGLGLSGYVNLNTVQTTAGVRLRLAFGRLATHKRIIKLNAF